MTKLVPSNTWTPVPGCAPADGPSIADSVTITGSPGEVASFQNGLEVWSLVLFDTPDDFRIDRYDATGAFIDSPITISRATGVITLHGRAMLSANPADPLEAATKAYVDAVSNTLATISDTAPASPLVGALWFDSTQAQMYVWFDDGSSQQWVPIVNQLNNAGGGSGPGPGAPVNTSGPVVTGTATAGSTLTTTNGTWSGTTPVYTYQWTRNGSPISGATSQTYVLTSTDASTSVACSVTATNSGGSASALSNSISVLPTAPVNSAAPVVSGSTSIGSPLTTTNGTWSGGPTFTYQWQRGVTNISGATAATYVLAPADPSKSISCIVTATNAAGSASAASNALAIPAFTFPGAPIGLYSLRKVGSGYAGQCLRVQRSSDNTQQDIGFDSNGNVNMSAIAAFCGSSQAFVYTWYDQSGNARNLSYGGGAWPQINMVAGRPWVCFYNQSGSSGAQMLFTAAAPNLTADMTVGFVGQLGTDYCCMPINQWNGSNGWFTTFNGSGFGGAVGATPGIFQVFSSGSGGVTLPDTGRYFARTNRYVAKRSGSTGTLYVNGATTKTGGLPASLTTTSPLAIGGDATAAYPFTGLMGEVYVYSSGISDTDRNSIDGNQAAAFPDTGFSTPYSGTSCVQFDYGEQISCGAVLTYERTNSWTVFGAVQLFFFPQQATVIYTNVLAQPWFGHELWVDPSGHVRVRLMGNWNGGVGNAGMAAVIGTTNVIDGKKHMLAYSYNGSSTAAGIKVYIDGVPETTTVESDTLAASMIGGTQNLIVGNQAGTEFDLTGTLSHFQVDNVARSASYIANYTPTSGTKIPPIDANTDMCLLLNDGSGTTATDSSSHGRNGTLNSAGLWVP